MYLLHNMLTILSKKTVTLAITSVCTSTSVNVHQARRPTYFPSSLFNGNSYAVTFCFQSWAYGEWKS